MKAQEAEAEVEEGQPEKRRGEGKGAVGGSAPVEELERLVEAVV